MRMFGQNVRAVRKQTSRAQDKLGLDKKMISYLELGERSPRLMTILIVANALEVPPQELFSGIGVDDETVELPPLRPDLDWPAGRFGANLRWIRLREEDVSQMDLGAEANIHRVAVGAIERGERGPKLHTILKLAWTLEVPPAVLFHGVRDGSGPEGTNGASELGDADGPDEPGDANSPQA
jgi:transcriptional regulator with XRE-family HTH domain